VRLFGNKMVAMERQRHQINAQSVCVIIDATNE